MLANRILHGGDYNPDQWLTYPGVFEEDIALMKQSHVNCVTLGIFAWSVMEPEEGQYQLDWLKKIVDRLEQEDISVIMATPSGGMPHWMSTRYPEVCQVQSDRTRNLPGKRHNFCYTSPVMRQKITALNTEIAKTLQNNQNVILWHISNELGNNFGDSTCHCPLCQDAFRNWLKKKYNSIDALNQAWWNQFWSHNYSDFSQIQSPSPQGETTCTALTLDWMRFSTEQMMDYCNVEIAAIKPYSDAPITTNFMYFFKGLDYSNLHKPFDVTCWDNYPFWHKYKDEVWTAVKASASHSMMRSLKKAPFLLMESSPSAINWRDVNPLRRPGVHMLSSLQAVAHGSDSVLYFQWRKSRGSFEKFHGAVVDHKNGTNTRVFREVTELGKRLETITPAIKDTNNQPKAAIIFDWENWWAVEDTSGPRADINYKKTILSHYRAFWEAGIEADFVSMDEDFSQYQLISAPLNYVYKPEYAAKIKNFVANGGTYITTYFSGLVDPNDLCFLHKHPLEEVLGVIEEEIDAPCDEFPNSFTYKDKTYPAGFMCDLVHPYEDTEVLAAYEQDFYAGMPVVSRHTYGKGQAYYLAAQSEQAFLNHFYYDLFEESGLHNALGCKLPYGVTVTKRNGASPVIFVMNFNHEAVTITYNGKLKSVDTDEVFDGSIPLAPFECKILQ